MSDDANHKSERSTVTGVDAVGFTLIAFAAFVVAVGVYGVSIIVDPSNEDLTSMAQRSEIVRNVGLFLLGVIGLPLAIWRSWIAKQQVDEAIAQGMRTERQLMHAENQLRATQDVANLGLVEKGGSLLEAEKQAQRSTGVMLLDAVCSQAEKTVSMAAANILFQFIKYHTNNDGLDYYLAASAYLEHLTRVGRRKAANLLDIDVIEEDASIDISDSRFDGIDITIPLKMRDCDMQKCFINCGNAIFEDCLFKSCSIVMMDAKSDKLRFEQCDFSACSMEYITTPEAISNCFYYSEQPPSDPILSAIGEKLDVRAGTSPLLVLPKQN